MKHPRGKLTYANVISTLCLFLLLGGGTAYAASQLGKESVDTAQLAREAVTPAKLSKASKAALSGPEGSKGATGAQGPKGDVGAVGPQGSTGEQGPRGDPGPKGDPGERGETGPPASTLWAVVEQDGTFARGKGILETQNLKTGLYEVKFSQHDVSQCDWQATVASPSFQSALPTRSIAVMLKTGDPEALLVEMNTPTFDPGNASFHLAVFC